MKKLFGLLAFALFSCSFYANGHQGTFVFVLDNDIFTGTDRNYTNGVRLSWVGEAAEAEKQGFFGSGYSKFLKDTFSFLPIIGSPSMSHTGSIALQQTMITPENITERERLPRESPYVGYTHIDFAVYAWDTTVFHEFELTLGAVGSNSAAKGSQRFIHKILNSSLPQGWDNQVGDRAIVEFSYFNGWRIFRGENSFGYGLDSIFNTGVILGNYSAGVSVGGIVRVGKNLPYNFNTFFVGSGSESASLGLFELEYTSGWYAYVGGFSTYNAYHYAKEQIKDTHALSVRDSREVMSIGFSYYNSLYEIGFGFQSSPSMIRRSNQFNNYGSFYLVFNI